MVRSAVVMVVGQLVYLSTRALILFGSRSATHALPPVARSPRRRILKAHASIHHI